MSNRIDKHNYYLDIAKAVSKRGTCLRRNFGAVIVKNDKIVATGYTGAPTGMDNCCDTGKCIREEQNVPRGTRYELCVHSDTLIPTYDMATYTYSVKKISEIEASNTLAIYTMGAHTHINPILKYDVKYMGKKHMIEVVFQSTHKSLICTEDHRIRMFDGLYKTAGTLKMGDMVSGWIRNNDNGMLLTPLVVDHIDYRYDSEDEDCYDICVPNTENFAITLDKDAGIIAHNCKSVHAEMNAIIQCDSEKLKGATLYVSGFDKATGELVDNISCCSLCTRMVINSGIKTVVCDKPSDGYSISQVVSFIKLGEVDTYSDTESKA